LMRRLEKRPAEELSAQARHAEEFLGGL